MFTRVSSLMFLFAKVIILFQLCKFFERNFHFELKFFQLWHICAVFDVTEIFQFGFYWPTVPVNSFDCV